MGGFAKWEGGSLQNFYESVRFRHPPPILTLKIEMNSSVNIQIGNFNEVLKYDGCYLNDHCLFVHAGLFHFFGIIGPKGKGCYDAGSEISFAHATSSDLINWNAHSEVLRVDGSRPDSAHIFAPHVIERNGLFYMFYTGVDQQRRQRICLATSKDLFAWERDFRNPLIVPSLFWAKWPGYGQPEDAVGNCRDTHVMRLIDGRYVMYWVAELNDRFGKDQSCIVASISEDLFHWQEIGPIFSMRIWAHPPTAAVESPCVIEKDGKFWLFFKHGWCTHFVQGESPFDFDGRQALPLGFSHASEIFFWENRWLISHCSADPNDFEYRKSNRTRGLFFSELDWPQGGSPRFKVK